MSEKKDIKNSFATKSFNISAMPLTSWVKFKEFAEMNCGDNYGMAIDKLLTYYEEDFKYALILEKITNLEEEVQALKSSPKETEKEIVKTFGGGVEG